MNRLVIVAAATAGVAAGLIARISVSIASTTSGGTAVYTANVDDDSVSALYQTTLGRIRSDIDVTNAPQTVKVSSDGLRVYSCENGSGIPVGPVADGTLPAIVGSSPTISIIDGNTDSFLQDVVVATNATVTDIALSPDGTKVWATLAGSGSIVAMDTKTLAIQGPYRIPTISSSTPNPISIDVSNDGASVFVLNADDSRVEKMSTTDGSSQGDVPVASDAAVVKVSADGNTLWVVGSSAPELFATTDLSVVAVTSQVDRGTDVDVGMAGGDAYVLNQNLVVSGAVNFGPIQKGAATSGPSIDVYDAATGAYKNSILLGANSSVLGIAVLSDGSEAFVSFTGVENSGSVLAVDLVAGTTGTSGSCGANPRRVAVNEIGRTSPIPSYFLPRSMSVKIVAKSDEKKGTPAPKDLLTASGFYDDGGAAVDYTQPVTITIGGYSRTVTLVPNKSKTNYKFKDGTLTFTALPNFRKSSLGKFTMRVAKMALGGLIDPTQPISMSFAASGMADATGQIKLTGGKYKLGKKPGDILAPAFFPAHAIAKLGGRNKDSIYFKGGFASLGTAPSSLATVRVAIGPQFTRSVAGSLFTKSPKANIWTFKSSVGKSKFSVVIDYTRETIAVTATNVEIGTFPGSSTDIVIDTGNGQGAYRDTIRLSNNTKGTLRNY